MFSKLIQAFVAFRLQNSHKFFLCGFSTNQETYFENFPATAKNFYSYFTWVGQKQQFNKLHATYVILHERVVRTLAQKSILKMFTR